MPLTITVLEEPGYDRYHLRIGVVLQIGDTTEKDTSQLKDDARQ